MIESSDWTPEELSIFALFSGRCGVCRIAESVTLHEICPKSINPKWKNPKNRIPVCNSCHTRIHSEGINLKSIRVLQDIRDSVEEK